MSQLYKEFYRARCSLSLRFLHVVHLLGNNIRKHGFNFHYYDTQLYMKAEETVQLFKHIGLDVRSHF